MKTLTLLRHAKSGWDDPVSRDIDRPLNSKGRRAAETVGRHLRATGSTFDHVIASPAIRVQETLVAVETGLGRRLSACEDRRIYLASAETLLDLVRDLPEQASAVLLVGHNPGLEDLVLGLVPAEADGLRDAVVMKFPTASLAVLQLACDRWADVCDGRATLAAFTRPRDLDPALGPDL